MANSNFEDWRKINPDKNNREFTLTFAKLANSSGALFDFDKLNNISKELIARYSVDDIYSKGLDWAKKYDLEFSKIFEQNPDYTKGILGIERSGQTNVRKDIAKWSDLKHETEYFFDRLFHLTTEGIIESLLGINTNDIKTTVKDFIESYREDDSKDQWFEKIKEISIEHGYAGNIKIFKEDPKKYKGYVADIAKIFRVLLTGRVNTPDLYSIMHIMGKDRVLKRLSVIK